MIRSFPSLLLDQGLPRETAEQLRKHGFACTHVGEIGMHAAADTAILAWTSSKKRLLLLLMRIFTPILP